MGEIMVEYKTWGSFGQYKREFVVLKNGKVLDPLKETAGLERGQKLVKTISIDGKTYKITVENRDSRKNAHRFIYVPEEIVVAVIEESKSSRNIYAPRVTKGEGEVVSEVIEKEQEINGVKYVSKATVTYYVNDKLGLKVVLKDNGDNHRPRVIVHDCGDIVKVTGKTYDVKDVLKRHGFRWNPAEKCWYASKIDVNVEEIVEVLKEYAWVGVRK